DEISEGRFILGLGTSGQGVVEGFHGRPYERPLVALRQGIAVVRALLRGERLSAAGVSARHRPFTLAMTPARRHVPIYCACLRPRAIALTGELADGWMPLLWPYDRLGDGIAQLRHGAERAGRSVADVVIAPFMPVIPYGDEYGLQEGLRLLAFYICAMGDHYAATLPRLGFAHAVAPGREAWASGRSEATAAIPPEMVQALLIIGDPEHCRAELARRCRDRADLAILNLPLGRGQESVESYIRLMAPSA